MKLIKKGAEAEIYQENNILIKKRINKGYRHEILDKKIIKSRTKSEGKILSKLKELGFPVPEIKNIKNSEIEMEFLRGDLVKNKLDKNVKLSEEIGKDIAVLHQNNIIHGDLTTSNMVLKDGKIFFIDFGLGYFSNRIEDKAVDLHLLWQVLESTHPRIAEEAYSKILKSYEKNYSRSKEVLTRLEKLEKRGRYKKD